MTARPDGWLRGGASSALSAVWSSHYAITTATAKYAPPLSHHEFIKRNPYIRPEKWDATGQTFFCPAAPITHEDPAESNFAWAKDPDQLNAGLTTYLFLNNYARLGVSQLGLPQYADRYHGGRMSVFAPTETLVQDWVLDPSTMNPSDPNKRLFQTSHEGGGNVLLVDGSMDWRPETDFTTGSAANGLKNATTLLCRPTARGW